METFENIVKVNNNLSFLGKKSKKRGHNYM